MGLFTGSDLDPVAVGAVIAVVISAAIAIYLGFKIRKLMNNTNSED